MNLTTTSIIILALLQVLQAVIVLGLLRQIGILSLRVLPAGARTLPSGPKIGEMLPALDVPDLKDAGTRLFIPPRDERPWIITFISPGCSTCQLVAPAIKALARETDGEIGWAVICLGSPTDCISYRQTYNFPNVLICHGSDQIRDVLDIGTTPYSLVTNANGVLEAKGLVNHIEHLESLVNIARDLRVAMRNDPVRDLTEVQPGAR